MSSEHFYTTVPGGRYFIEDLTRKKALIALLLCVLLTAFGLALFAAIDLTTSGYITKVEPLDPITRSIQEGSGLLVEQNNHVVKLKNTGTYDVLPGVGIIVDSFIENYPIVSVNQTYINANFNVTCNCQNISLFVNVSTMDLTADESIILTPNPWNPTTSDATISGNQTYIRENLALSSLTESTGIIMSSPIWNPTGSGSDISVNVTYIRENLNLNTLTATSPLSITPDPWNPTSADATLSITLSTLTQGNGIIMSSPIWDPASTASNISVNVTYIRENLNLNTLTAGTGISMTTNPYDPVTVSSTISANLTSLNATNGITMTPNPWNPSTSVAAVIELDQEGFSTVMTTNAAVLAGGVITGGWNITVQYTYTKGGFDITSGAYTVPSSGIYSFNFKITTNSGTGIVSLRINSVSAFSASNTAPVFFIGPVTLPLITGDVIDIVTQNAKTVTGGGLPYVTWFNGLKIGTF